VGLLCGAPVWCSCVRDVYFGSLCVWKASVYLSKRINSSLLTKIFNGIGWEGCETQRQRIGWPLLFIVQWVIRNKAGLNIITKPCGEWNHHMTQNPKSIINIKRNLDISISLANYHSLKRVTNYLVYTCKKQYPLSWVHWQKHVWFGKHVKLVL